MLTAKKSHRCTTVWRTAAATCLAVATMAHAAPVDLADQPLFSTSGAPGNVLLALSVEWPTASTPAYLSTTAYSTANTYVGYFDPAKCYRYTNHATPANGYFTPDSMATSHVCTSTAAKALWSGNYLNWATAQTMDAFRWALTGGDRVVDTTTETIMEKTRHSGQGARSSIYPDKVLSAGISGATPFNFGSGLVVSRVHGLGTALYFSGGQEVSCAFATNGSRGTTFTCDASSVGSNTLAISTANGTPTEGISTNCHRSNDRVRWHVELHRDAFGRGGERRQQLHLQLHDQPLRQHRVRGSGGVHDQCQRELQHRRHDL